MIGLSGVHGSGKTTLMKAYAAKHSIPWQATSTAEVFRELGIAADDTAMDFTVRLTVQEAILVRLERDYKAGPIDGRAITDRTPLDLMMYTYAEALAHTVTKEDQDRLAAYTNRCFEILNRYFTTIIILQPGIPVESRPGQFKGAVNNAYMEHLNSLVLGLTVGERLTASHFYMPRRLTDLEERIVAVHKAVTRTGVLNAAKAQELVDSGFMLH